MEMLDSAIGAGVPGGKPCPGRCGLARACRGRGRAREPGANPGGVTRLRKRPSIRPRQIDQDRAAEMRIQLGRGKASRPHERRGGTGLSAPRARSRRHAPVWNTGFHILFRDPRTAPDPRLRIASPSRQGPRPVARSPTPCTCRDVAERLQSSVAIQCAQARFRARVADEDIGHPVGPPPS